LKNFKKEKRNLQATYDSHFGFKKLIPKKNTKYHMQKWVLSKIGSQGMRNTYFLGMNKVLQV
jgi:hypothetical protein